MRNITDTGPNPNSLRQVLPDYEGGGIANLMASIAQARGGGPLACPPLTVVDDSAWRDARCIVLIAADGVGSRQIETLSPHGLLARNKCADLSSVFLSTTACAITTLMSGQPPRAHGLVGWHMYFDEIDAMLAVLPLTRRGLRSEPPEELARRAELLFGAGLPLAGLSGAIHALGPDAIHDSPFSRAYGGGAQRSGHFGTADMFERICELAQDRQGPRYVYAYFDTFDACSHRYGCQSDQARAVLEEFELRLQGALQRLAGSGTLLIVTADHGFIDAPLERLIELDDHPQLAGMLARPLWGERRVAFCSLQPGSQKQFERYVATEFASICDGYRSSDLIDAGWFGPPPQHERLAARVGDYTLVMRDDWTLRDVLPDERPYDLAAVHGGMSDAEMRVPLAVFAC